MTTLISAGSSVTITDESFYSSSGPGTVPLIIISTEQDKIDSSGTLIASGTIKSNANKLQLITSQRELLQTYGNPNFNSIGGTALHGFELNEYGLLAAHSYLGIANRAYVLRADIDLAQLAASDVEPTDEPADGTYWLDLNDTRFGLNEYNGTTWVRKDVVVVDDIADAPAGTPEGVAGDYAIVVTTNENNIFKRDGAVWKHIDNADVSLPDFQYASHINYPLLQSDGITPLAVGDLWIKTTEPNLGALYKVRMYNASTASFVEVDAPLYASRDLATTGLSPVEGDLFVHYDPQDGILSAAKATHVLKRHNGLSVTTAAGSTFNPVVILGNALEINGSIVTFTGTTLNSVVADINAAGIPDIQASKSSSGSLVITNLAGKDIVLNDDTGTPSVALGLTLLVAYTNWSDLVYEVGYSQPTLSPADGTLWYSTDIKVDILVNDGVGAWQDFTGTLSVQPSQPSAPVVGDIWVDTDQVDEYPVIYRFNGVDFVLVDNTDQTTPLGIVFRDARPLNTGLLDADAPDPLVYPKDMLLFNTRYSTLNVKKWILDYTYEGVLIGDRWVTESGLKLDGSPYMGRHAVKRVITEAMASVILSNDEIRSEAIFYNLIVAPGFPELMDEMITLNVDRKETSFIIGDSPFRLKSSGTALQQWATNANNAASNGDDGLLAASPYLGVYYPSGFTSNLDGEEVVVPSSHLALRTIAYNDQVSYQWFAPAGLNRGLINNATSVGYVDDEDEFVPVVLNEGQRDVLYANNINPISQIPNRGLAIWGQKTRSPVESALDRINVARLVNYIRYQADKLAQPFLFEPNDSITRQAVKNAYDRFLSELITLRGLYDFIVVVDESNNTPGRIDRNELWIDIAIQPVKSIEFIYIPIRIKNTGSDLAS